MVSSITNQEKALIRDVLTYGPTKKTFGELIEEQMLLEEQK